MMMAEKAPIPYQRKRGAHCRLGPAGLAIAGYSAYFAFSMSLFGTLILLSLLP